MAISSTLRTPGMFVEFDSSRAFQGPSVLEYKTLLMGQLLSTGSKYDASADAVGPFEITSADQAAEFAGFGSQIHRQAIRFFGNAKGVRAYMVGLKDDGAAVQASGTITVGGAPTATGVLYVYVNGTQYQITVTTSDTTTTIAAAIAAAINADADAPVTAAAALAVATITAKNGGTAGNDIDIRVNYNDGEELPAGVTAAVVDMASGAGDIDYADAIALLGEEWYNIWTGPLYGSAASPDTTNLDKIKTELADRYGPERQIDGVFICALRGTLSELTTFGGAQNSPHVSCVQNGGVTGVGGPVQSLEKAAALAGRVAARAQNDPARPYQNLELIGILPPAISERFSNAEENSLLQDGIASTYVDQANAVRITRVITQYQTNAAGAADIAYLDVNTMLTLMYLRYDWRTTILSKYPDAKLADDGAQFAPGQVVITPKIGKAEAVAKFRQWEFAGLVENADQFKADLICERSTTDPNRLEWTLPPDLVNQFRVGATALQFLLQSPAI